MQVVIGLILDKFNRVLITQRPLDKPLGGFWEFPGGKIEFGESAEAALKREIAEEVGLTVLNCRFLDLIHGESTEKSVPKLNVYLVTAWSGEARCLETQMGLAWISVSDLNHYTFPPANQLIVQKLQGCIYAE